MQENSSNSGQIRENTGAAMAEKLLLGAISKMTMMALIVFCVAADFYPLVGLTMSAVVAILCTHITNELNEFYRRCKRKLICINASNSDELRQELCDELAPIIAMRYVAPFATKRAMFIYNQIS